MARVTTEGALEIAVARERVRLEGFEADVGEGEATQGAEVLVFFDAPDRVTLHVYGREIADGALTCSLGARRAAVSLDVGLLARVLAEALARGLELPGDSARALREALGLRE
jgi:hypothetical protein